MSQSIFNSLIKESEEVYYTLEPIFTISERGIHELKSIADSNNSGKVRICCHKAKENLIHEMLIVIKKGTPIKIHKHLDKPEAFHIIEGHLSIILFDDFGKIIKTIEMSDLQSGKAFYYRSEEPTFHTVIPLSEFAVFHEITKGPFDPQETVFANFNFEMK